MKHLVIVPDGIPSKRLSGVELARRLSDAGYRITFIGKGGDYHQIDRFDYFRLDLGHELPATDSQSSIDEPDHPLHLLLEKISPDLVLIDVEMHEFVLAALASNFPVALFSVFFNMRKHKSMPPLHYTIVPGKGVAGFAFMIELAWLRFRLSKFISNLREKIRCRGKDTLSRLENYAAKLGLRLADHVDRYQWLIPFVYKKLPIMVLSPIEMEFPFRPHQTVTYVGPMICKDRQRLSFLPDPVELNEDIKELLDSYRQPENGRRLIYCSFGCVFSGSDEEFWSKLIESFRNTEWDVIFALGNRLKPNSFREIPPNIHCLEFAPQMDILPFADCAIIHSGLMTMLECIYFKVPMVTYPFDVNDQQGNAARIAYHRIGIRGDRLQDSPGDIRRHVYSAMNDNEIKMNLNRMQHHISSYETSHSAADAVERILRKTL